jgi:hypothetical protein
LFITGGLFFRTTLLLFELFIFIFNQPQNSAVILERFVPEKLEGAMFGVSLFFVYNRLQAVSNTGFYTGVRLTNYNR